MHAYFRIGLIRIAEMRFTVRRGVHSSNTDFADIPARFHVVTRTRADLIPFSLSRGLESRRDDSGINPSFDLDVDSARDKLY